MVPPDGTSRWLMGFSLVIRPNLYPHSLKMTAESYTNPARSADSGGQIRTNQTKESRCLL